MLGNTVSPHLSREYFEVRRMISDGKMHGAVSALYSSCVTYAYLHGRGLVTYTFNSDPVSVLAAGAIPDGARRSGTDCRGGRVNATRGIVKYRFRWPPL